MKRKCCLTLCLIFVLLVSQKALSSENRKSSTLLVDPCSITNPVDIVVHRENGNVYVLSSSPSKVYILDGNLNRQNIINISATKPMGLALDNSDRIYVTDTGGNRILRYTSSGSLDTSFDSDGIVGQTGTDDGQFNAPWGIAVDFKGNVYVSDSGNNRIQTFAPNGRFISKWGQSGTSNGQLNSPAGMCYVSGGISGSLYVADKNNNRVQRLFASSGNCYSLTDVDSQLDKPTDVYYDFNRNQIIVADSNNNRLQIFDEDEGSFILAKVICDPDFKNPMAMAYENDLEIARHIIYVADTGNNRLLKLEVQDDIGPSPIDIFNEMKLALKNNDIEKAVSFFYEDVQDDYRSIFKDSQNTKIKNMVDSMGSLTLSMDMGSLRVYEISVGENLYPIEFIKNSNGNWKIMKF